MSISSYYKERDKLFAEQKAERELLLAHGIDAGSIDKLHGEDYAIWKSDRNYARHNKISSEEYGEEALSLAWLRENPCDEYDKAVGGFLDSIGNEKLLAVLRRLDADDLAMVEACLIHGVKQEDYAASVGKSRSAVTRKLLRIKEKIVLALK